MAALEKLANELVGLVFAFAPDLHTAVSLSATSRWLRTIWLQGAERYTFEIRKSNIIACEQAVELAIAEEHLEGQLGHSGVLTTADPPFQDYAGRLFRNEELAKSAADAFRDWLENQCASSYRRKLTFDCPHTAYYLVRKLALAYRHPQAQLQTSLLETLRTSSPEALRTNAELMRFLGGQASEEERIKHGMPMPEEDWPMPENEYAKTVNLPEWDYAGDVVGFALGDYLHGAARLEPAMNSVFEKHDGRGQ
jgi:hypothetical protein